MWEELGIAPTADPREIRRAYAKRLRDIDADRDGDAFQRLRQAYERALAAAERPRPPSERRPARPAPDAGGETRSEAPPTTMSRERAPVLAIPPPAAASESLPDEGEVRATRARLRRALAAGDIDAAIDQTTEAWAKGLLPLAGEQGIIAELMTAAVKQTTLPPERFRAMARQWGWDKPAPIGRDDGEHALREQIAQRLEAEAWYERLRAAAQRKHSASFVERQERWLARILLGQTGRWRLHLIHYGLIRWQMAPYERFEPWLGQRIDVERVLWLKAALRTPGRRWPSAAFWALNVVSFGLVLLVVALPFLLYRAVWPASLSRRPRAPLLAEMRRITQPRVEQGIPRGLLSLRALNELLLLVLTKVATYTIVAILVLTMIAAGIAFPPLGLIIFIASRLYRNKKQQESRKDRP